jgi:uncharacterized protein YdeI (YjbR/CyaY-like superfamily)
MATIKKKSSKAKRASSATPKDPQPPRKRAAAPTPELPIVEFAQAGAWLTWLESHHASSRGVLIKLAKKNSQQRSITYQEALDGALRWGWIDGQALPLDEQAWLRKFTPRSTRSMWSKINRDKALALIARGEMRPPGLLEVERAQRDGRWDKAYDSPSTATIPDDFAAALAGNARATAFFEKLDAANRYAMLWRLQTAKRAKTRALRIELFVAMLARREKIHP